MSGSCIGEPLALALVLLLWAEPAAGIKCLHCEWYSGILNTDQESLDACKYAQGLTYAHVETCTALKPVCQVYKKYYKGTVLEVSRRCATDSSCDGETLPDSDTTINAVCCTYDFCNADGNPILAATTSTTNPMTTVTLGSDMTTTTPMTTVTLDSDMTTITLPPATQSSTQSLTLTTLYTTPSTTTHPPPTTTTQYTTQSTTRPLTSTQYTPQTTRTLPRDYTTTQSTTHPTTLSTTTTTHIPPKPNPLPGNRAPVAIRTCGVVAWLCLLGYLLIT